MTDAPRCPLCLPRPDDSAQWIKIQALSMSTLYLDRNQTYRGHCQLVHDGDHAEGLEHLPEPDFNALMADLRQAATAITRVCRPDRMNYASLGNVVPHVHWHLVPRYLGDPRWGSPIYTSDVSDMPVTRLAEREYAQLVHELRARLGR